MAALKASRTLVKSAPELWAECSEAASLAKHLGAFGEIRITKLEPETAVAWEGDAASGTVALEPAGWGTRVTLTASAEIQAPARAEIVAPAQTLPATPEAAAAAEPPPPPDQRASEQAPGPWPGTLGRLFSLILRRSEPPRAESLPEPDRAALQAPVIRREPVARPVPARSALDAALDSLGRAHHRPYSRA